MSFAPFPPRPVLVVDDDRSFLQSLAVSLRSAGITNLVMCMDGERASAVLSEQDADLVLLDLGLPGVSGLDLLSRLRDIQPDVPVVIVTGSSELDTAVECMRNGASDYIVKPVERSRLLATIERCLHIRSLERENSALRDRLMEEDFAHPDAFSDLITVDPRLRSVLKYVEAIADSPHTVLITGETGTGKDLVAEIIHRLSGREGELVTLNIAGLDDAMFSDTLFGHLPGSYTGATSARAGLIDRAAGGTLFLDEIGDLGLSAQVRLLGLLEKREYYPLGADTPRRSDARVIVATHQDLQTLMTRSQFRKDLYYRLRTHRIHLPPLRERPDDIPLLAEYFAALAAESLGCERPSLSTGALRALQDHTYPGNVRELRAMVFDAVSRSGGGRLTSGVLGFDEETEEPRVPVGEGEVAFGARLPTIKRVTELLVEEALRRAGGNKSAAARMVGITPQAMSKRVRGS